MQFTDQISILIFALILVAVVVFLTMSKLVVGPLAKLRKVERVVLISGLIGVLLVLAMAASELLFHVLF
ncbi:MAG TPA: hypothetical protein ENJ01_12245 [Gammaproteobacteria bacterium]|nr:hypothetical protein [Gammaproteobacteria bacterium]